MKIKLQAETQVEIPFYTSEKYALPQLAHSKLSLHEPHEIGQHFPLITPYPYLQVKH